MSLIFRNSKYAVHTCGCGCDIQVKVTLNQDRAFTQFYIGHHAGPSIGDEQTGVPYDANVPHAMKQATPLPPADDRRFSLPQDDVDFDLDDELDQILKEFDEDRVTDPLPYKTFVFNNKNAILVYDTSPDTKRTP